MPVLGVIFFIINGVSRQHSYFTLAHVFCEPFHGLCCLCESFPVYEEVRGDSSSRESRNCGVRRERRCLGSRRGTPRTSSFEIRHPKPGQEVGSGAPDFPRTRKSRVHLRVPWRPSSPFAPAGPRRWVSTDWGTKGVDILPSERVTHGVSRSTFCTCFAPHVSYLIGFLFSFVE